MRNKRKHLNVALFASASHCSCIPTMKTSGKLLGFFNVLCLFWLTKQSIQLSAPDVVTGTYGGSVTVPCQYDHRFREHTKYWCKGPIYELCKIVVKTPRNRHSDRSSITDDKEAGVFTVTMMSLRESDKDMYWCVIARPGINVFTSVRLLISQAVITTTTASTTASPSQQDEISWWAILRWILFILMLCCLVSTHIAVWRIEVARKTRLKNNVNIKTQTSMIECQATPQFEIMDKL